MGAQQSVPKITAQDRAILDLKLQRDKLRQYQKNIQYVLNREHEIAKAHLAAGQKDRAVTALRRRKYQETLLVKTDGQLENLEQLVSTIEFSLIEVSVLHGLKVGNEVLKEIHKEMDINKVEKLLEETAEAQAYQREIDEMLSGALTRDDEAAVLEEMEQMEAQARLEAGIKAPAADIELPSVPTDAPVVREDTKTPAKTERVAIPS